MFIDLLFFNRELNCLVAAELKTGKFKPSYLGQLNTYLTILDDKVRKEHENPSVGLILCKDMNKAFVDSDVANAVLNTLVEHDLDNSPFGWMCKTYQTDVCQIHMGMFTMQSEKYATL